MATPLVIDFGTSMNSRLLNDRNPFKYIYYLSNKYGAATTLFSALAGGKSSEKVETLDGKKEILTISHTGVQAQVATRTTSGTDLILTFTDPTYEAFRVSFVAIDGSTTRRSQGYIKSKAAGTITIAQMGTAFTAADFAVGSYVTEGWQASANNGSTGVDSKYVMPSSDYNFSSIKRDSRYLSRRDFVSSYMSLSQGGKPWAMMQEEEMIRDYARKLEYARLFEQRGQLVLNGKLTNQNGSLLWAITNRGGTHVTSTSELVQDEWLDLIDTISKKSGQFGGKLICIHGTDALGTIQRFTQGFIQQAGKNNTFKAEYGIDMGTYQYNGVEINFLYSPLFDDLMFMGGTSTINGKHRASSSFFLIDASPVDTYGMNDGIASSIVPFHFGEQQMFYGYVPGVIGPDGGSPSNYIKGKYSLMTNSVDGVTCEVLHDGGIDIPNASRMLFWELAS